MEAVTVLLEDRALCSHRTALLDNEYIDKHIYRFHLKQVILATANCFALVILVPVKT